jgi:hypothetical protein
MTNTKNNDLMTDFKIIKVHKGVASDFVFKFKGKLAVITGLNGSRKTILLNSIYRQYLDYGKFAFFKKHKL